MIKYGNLSMRAVSLVDKPFEEVIAENPSINKMMLKGAWDIANPKGVKAPKKDKELESKDK